MIAGCITAAAVAYMMLMHGWQPQEQANVWAKFKRTNQGLEMTARELVVYRNGCAIRTVRLMLPPTRT